MRTQTTTCPKEITDPSQMHPRPGRRCYIMTLDGVPCHRLTCMRLKSSTYPATRWYGWISVNKHSDVDSIINSAWPMSDTAKGAIRNEIGRTTYIGWGCGSGLVPYKFYEFHNMEEVKVYFESVIKDRARELHTSGKGAFEWRW